MKDINIWRPDSKPLVRRGKSVSHIFKDRNFNTITVPLAQLVNVAVSAPRHISVYSINSIQ